MIGSSPSSQNDGFNQRNSGSDPLMTMCSCSRPNHSCHLHMQPPHASWDGICGFHNTTVQSILDRTIAMAHIVLANTIGNIKCQRHSDCADYSDVIIKPAFSTDMAWCKLRLATRSWAWTAASSLLKRASCKSNSSTARLAALNAEVGTVRTIEARDNKLRQKL